MSNNIMLVSTKSGSGKSVIAIGAFLKLKQEGKNPGYFKPIGDAMSMSEKTKVDKDVNVITTVVSRKFAKEEICPQFFNPDYFLDEVTIEESDSIVEKIKDAYKSMEGKTDFMIIEGNHSVNQFSAVKLDDVRMAKELGASVVICGPIGDDDDLNDRVGVYNDRKLNEVPVKGVIINGVNELAHARIDKYFKPLLENLNIPVIGGLKKSKQLEKPTIAEVMEAVNGKMISGNFIQKKNHLVDGFLIAAMGAESALSYLRKGVNQCISTGGDRSDIALAALDTSTAMIIFTGNLKPASRIMCIAEEKGIPLILAPGDTFTVSEQIRKIHTHIQPNEIGICLEQVEKFIDWDLLIK